MLICKALGEALTCAMNSPGVFAVSASTLVICRGDGDGRALQVLLTTLRGNDDFLNAFVVSVLRRGLSYSKRRNQCGSCQSAD
jgi:hypothetical protein